MAASEEQSPDDRIIALSSDQQRKINCVAWLPDGRIVIGSDDYFMRILNWMTAEQEGTSMLHQFGRPIRGIMTTKDGRIISCGYLDHDLVVWNAATQELLHRASAPDGMFGAPEPIALSPNEDLLVSYHSDGIVFWEVAETIQVRNRIDRELTMSILKASNPSRVMLSFCPDGKRLATCHYDVEVNIFDVESGEHIFGPLSHRDEKIWTHIGAITWSLDGARLFSGWLDGSIRHSDLRTGETIRKALRGSPSNATHLAFSPDAKWLASSSPDSDTVDLWDTESGDPGGEPIHFGSDFHMSGMRFSRSGGRIACFGRRGDDWGLLIIPVSGVSEDDQQVLQSLLDQPAVISSDGPSSNARETNADFLDISGPHQHLPPRNGLRENSAAGRPRMRSSTVSWKWWKIIPRLVLHRPSPVYMGRAEPGTYVASRHTADSSSNSESPSQSPASSEDDPNAMMVDESDSGESDEEGTTDTPPDDIEVGRAGCCGLLSRPSRQSQPRQRRDVSAPRSAHPTRPPNSADTATPVPPSTRPAVQDILDHSAVV